MIRENCIQEKENFLFKTKEGIFFFTMLRSFFVSNFPENLKESHIVLKFLLHSYFSFFFLHFKFMTHYKYFQ